MKILGIETTTDACSCALLVGTECEGRFELAPRRHSELVLPMVAELTAQAGVQLGDVDAIAFGRGPGSFTGLRIAAGVAQGLAFAADLPVVPVSSLQVLAQGVARTHAHPRVLAALDARIREIYWGMYAQDENGIMTPLAPDAVCAPQAAQVPETGAWLGSGQGWSVYASVLAQLLHQRLVQVAPDCFPDARDLLHIAAVRVAAGDVVGAELALPVYLRDKVTN